MANVQRNTRCKICDALIPIARLRRHPAAVLCGSPACDVEHQRRRHNHSQQTWRAARVERDPEFRAREGFRSGLRRKRKAEQARGES